MIKGLSIILVCFGLVCLLAALRPAFVVCRTNRNKGWCLLLVLIGLFTLAYSIFFWILLKSNVSLVEMGVSGILAGGGAFVVVVIRLSHHSIMQAQVKAEREFHEARHDILTGLPNRMHFMECLRDVIETSKIENTKFAVFMIDLDRFKEVNDSLGHGVGDTLLEQLGARLKDVSDDDNLVCRLGGDEFAVIQYQVDEAEVVEECKRLTCSVEDSFIVGDHSLVIDLSIGIALFPKDGVDQESLLKRADIAMYLAKEKKQAFMLYDEAEDTLSPQRVGLISRVKEALEQGDFELYYQPIISMNGGSLYGFEALIRWRQSDGSFISPAEFIPQIEKSRFIGSVSRWVIGRAIKQLHSWANLGLDFCMCVNLSAVDLHDQELVAYIESCANEFNVPLKSLCFEMTESAIMVDTVRAKEVINKLSALGAKISMDDFGTGFSSLSLLRDFPANILKIDQSFVKNMASSLQDHSIVKCMIELSHSLDKQVVAEGIEDQQLLAVLSDLGCDFAQGYYLSRPMEYHKVAAWLEDYCHRCVSLKLQEVPPTKLQHN